MIKRIWLDIKGDIKRIALWFSVALIAILALELIPWGSSGGDLLSAVAFIYSCIMVLVHIMRRLLLPQIQLMALARKASEEPFGAAVIFLSVAAIICTLIFTFVFLFVSPAGASQLPEGLPKNAYTNLPIVKQAQEDYWPSLSEPSYLAAQVEQETCYSLKHKKCWSRYAELNTDRERGVGLGQATKTNRFDTLSELREQYKDALSEWSWEKPYNATYQARGLVLQSKRLYGSVRNVATETDRIAMTLNQYNAGPAMLARSRTACASMTGCRHDVWFNNVELAGGPSQVKAKGYSKSFYQISREYVRNVLLVRRDKYRFMDDKLPIHGD